METVTLARRQPLLPCCYLVGNRHSPELQSCGALIPFQPRKPCPECGRKQGRSAATEPPPGALIVSSDTAIMDAESGKVVAVLSTGLERLATEVAQHLRHISWNDNMDKNAAEGRLSGIRVTHRTFGYRPPVPLRKRWACSRTLFDSDYPDTALLMDDFVREAAARLAAMAPDAYANTVSVTSVIPETWRMLDTPWTSGIINRTAALPYHLDSGNIPGSWSAMLTSRHDISGGYLHLADYDAYLAVPHGSISIFDGQSVLHGVTPLHRSGSDAYRYTIVAYAKSGMKVCCPDPADEPARAQRRATAAEDARIGRRNVGT